MERRGYGGNKNVHLEGFEEDKEKENWQKRSVSSKMGHVSELSSNARCFLLSQRNSSSKAEPMYVDCGYAWIKPSAGGFDPWRAFGWY